jgi:catechol 2,3-dioxygenase-like lactoylglutathione lyase family enzyme
VPILEELEIADEPADWRALGFDVEDGACQVSTVRLRLVGKGPRRGILGWTLGEVEPGAAAATHPNGVARIDHVVLLSPDLDRTVDELRSQGFDLRRIREGETPGGSTRQAFFRLGEPILEVVQAPEGTPDPPLPRGRGQASVARNPDGPARLWGLAFRVEDMDATASALGELLGAPRAAVQPGREIATLRPEAGLGPAIAFMTPP